MKTKYTTSHQEFYSPSEHLIKNYNYDHYNHPIKSPSPDKKSANIIASTKSPEVAEIKRYHHTPDKDLNSMWMSRQSGREKPFSIATPSKIVQTRHYVQEKNFPETNMTEQRNQSSGMRNTKIEIIASGSPEDFDDKHKSSRTRQVIRSESNQLDYLKLLKSKEDTIRELKDIIAMIKRSQGNADQQLDASTSQLRQRIHQLTEEAKTLRIENQHLYNIIEKSKKSGSSQKEESSSRKVRELQDTLRQNKLEYQDRYQNFERQMNRLKEDLKRLQIENQSLLKLLKQKDDNLGSSSMSIQSKSSEKEKLSLIKIKQQYSQNLKLMKENFAREIQQIQTTSMYQLENMSNKIDELTLRLQNVEDQKDAIQRRLPEHQEKINVREEFHKQKLRYHEIETLMLERHNSVEKELLNQKKNNERLINQLSKVTKAHEQLQNKSQLYWQELSVMRSSKIKDGQLQNVVNERNQLYDQNGRLKLENSRKGAQFEEYKLNNNRDVRELENKIQTIVTEYEKRLNYYEKDKQDTEQKVTMAIELYQKQKEQYQKVIISKNNQIDSLNQKIESLEYEHSRFKENGVSEQQLGKIQFQCQQFRQRCLNFESEIEKMSSELVQMDIQSRQKNRINLQLQEQVGNLQQEREDLRKKLGQAQMSNDDLAVRISRKERQVVDLQQNINGLQKNIYEQEQTLSTQIQNLKRQNSELQHKEESLLSTLYGREEAIRNQEGEINHLNKMIEELKRKQKDFVSFNQFDFMEDELNELKRVVQEYLATNSSKNQGEILQEYYKLTYNYQVKIQENLKYLKQIDELKKQLIKREDQKNKMQEQIDYLKNTTNIYEHELKERRLLYDQLLQQKTRIEKEALMSKKIKIEQSQRQSSYRTNVNDITTRIDRLLELETKRNQNMKNLYIVKQASS